MNSEQVLQLILLSADFAAHHADILHCSVAMHRCSRHTVSAQRQHWLITVGASKHVTDMPGDDVPRKADGTPISYATRCTGTAAILVTGRISRLFGAVDDHTNALGCGMKALSCTRCTEAT